MWNNLKSDIYRTLHTKSFFVITFFILLCFTLILCDSGMQNNTSFASFYRSNDTFNNFLFYFPKSMMFSLLVLIFIGMFATDEYNSGFVKNTYPLSHNKFHLVIEKYFYCLILITFFAVLIILSSLLIQAIYPMKMGTFKLSDYLPFLIVNIMTIAAAGSFSMLLTHLTRSKVLIILFSIGYGMIIYMIMSMLLIYLFKDADLLNCTMYVLSGKLPYVFDMEAYRDTILVVLGNTLLYNGISYILLKKRDI